MEHLKTKRHRQELNKYKDEEKKNDKMWIKAAIMNILESSSGPKDSKIVSKLEL